MGKTVINGDFEWDADKAAANIANHDGVTFEEAATVFQSDETLEEPDATHLERLNTIGFSAAARLLLVVSTEVVEGRVRIISAWPATASERRKFANSRRKK